MKITLCDKVLEGDIPEYYFKDKEKALDFVDSWIESKDLEKSVLVLFSNWIPVEELRNEQNAFLVSHNYYDITDFYESYLDLENHDNIDFNIFEFDSYKEAFKYCIDLKESF